MKVAIIGSRTFSNPHLVMEYISKKLSGNDILVSGGAEGPDSIAEHMVKNLDFPEPIIIKPDWDKYGKRAGFVRNKLIVEEADRIVAFWDGKSKGTKHSIDYANELRKPVEIIYDKDKEKDLLDYI